MNILIVKTSSLGDVLHTLPAVSDLLMANPEISIDWVVEPQFQEIPSWHAAIKEVIPFAWRKWRKNIFLYRKDIMEFFLLLRSKQYDIVIDPQGLLKSAVIVFLARGEKIGLSWNSIREPLATIFYQKRIHVAKNMHAVERIRVLFSKIFNYTYDPAKINYGINKEKLQHYKHAQRYIVILHGTTWQTKHYPNSSFKKLIEHLIEEQFDILVPWGNEKELQRAQYFKEKQKQVHILPKMQLAELSSVLAAAYACIAVDTGLGHLAAALEIPTISLYGATNPNLTGTYGLSQIHLQSQFVCSPCLKRKCIYPNNTTVFPPCFSDINPIDIKHALQALRK